MTRFEQKQKEKGILRGFLHTVGIRGARIYFEEQPDLRFLLRGNNVLNGTGRIGVEVTQHFNDATVGSNSDGQRLLNFWTVRLSPAIVQVKAQSLNDVHAFISFNHRELTKRALNCRFADLIARQIVDVVRDTAQNMLSGEAKRVRNFSVSSELRNIIKYIEIRRICAWFGPWDANFSASNMGLNSAKLAEIIKGKDAKAEKYAVSQFDEIWLLIAAPHDNSFNALRIRAEEVSQLRAFRSKEVIAASRSSHFARIFFWADRPDDPDKRWWHPIWPQPCNDVETDPECEQWPQ